MEFDEEAEEQELQKLRTTLKLFASPDRVERCKDGPGFHLIRWVRKNGWADGGIGMLEEYEYFETVEELIVGTNAAITKRANDKFVAAAGAEGRRGK